MDDFTTITVTLKKITDQLEDNSLQNHITKNPKYIALQSHLATKGYVDYNIFQKVLNICVRDLEEDIKYTAIALKIIITILKKIKVRFFYTCLRSSDFILLSGKSFYYIKYFFFVNTPG